LFVQTAVFKNVSGKVNYENENEQIFHLTPYDIALILDCDCERDGWEGANMSPVCAAVQ
jgi:hypothetical protein